jgi:uncharacterized protein YjbI with pentapeptide repeats
MADDGGKVSPLNFAASIRTGQTNWAGRDFSNANLRSAIGIEFRGQPAPEIVGFDFSGADLRRTDLSGLTFRDCNFTGAKLNHAALSGAEMHDCQMDNADLSQAFARGATFHGSTVEGAKFHEAEFNEFAFAADDNGHTSSGLAERPEGAIEIESRGPVRL